MSSRSCARSRPDATTSRARRSPTSSCGTRLRAALARPRPYRERLEVGGLTLDRRARTASYRGRPVPLNELEFGLLVRLAHEPYAVLTRGEVWGCEVGPKSRTIDAHASRLRRKLASAGAEGLVATRRGVGYSLLAPHAGAA